MCCSMSPTARPRAARSICPTPDTIPRATNQAIPAPNSSAPSSSTMIVVRARAEGRVDVAVERGGLVVVDVDELAELLSTSS